MDEVDQSPQQRGGGRFCSGYEQIQSAQGQIGLSEAQVRGFVLWRETEKSRVMTGPGVCQRGAQLTYVVHFNQEGVDVVPRVVVVQVLLVPLNLLPEEVSDGAIMVEHFVVWARQGLHHSRERLIQLLRKRTVGEGHVGHRPPTRERAFYSLVPIWNLPAKELQTDGSAWS